MAKKSRTIETLTDWKNTILLRGSGTISDACDMMGIARSTYYKWCDSNSTEYWEQFAELIPAAIEEQRQRRIDEAEEQLFRMAKEGNFNAVKLVLERLGRDRGWAQYQEMNLGGAKDIEIKFE